MDIYDRIELLLKTNKSNKQALCSSAGISYNTLASLFKRRSKNMDLETIKKIAACLNTTTDYLINGNDAEATIEEKLQRFIPTEYGSVRAFSIAANIPYSTIDNVFDRGLAHSTAASLIKIGNALKISFDSLVNGNIVKLSEKEQLPPPNNKLTTITISSNNKQIIYKVTEKNAEAIVTILDGMQSNTSN